MKYYPASQREHRGFAYGKQRWYFDPDYNEYRWANVLGPAITAQAPGIDPKSGRPTPFEVIAMVDAPGSDLYDQNLTNIGSMHREYWTDNLAKSKFMVSLHVAVPSFSFLIAVMFYMHGSLMLIDQLGVGKPNASPSRESCRQVAP
jgi:hypothetical protein